MSNEGCGRPGVETPVATVLHGPFQTRLAADSSVTVGWPLVGEAWAEEGEGGEEEEEWAATRSSLVLASQLAHRLPARVQGYPWRLAYSTLEHGTSLKTLYRKSASLDSPVLLVVKDMDNQVFGAYATHPFKFSDHYYGTGETFLYTFSPNFKVFKWSGENSYFINGDLSSLELGGGGGRFGLWLDADLYHGRSNSCSTFNNDVLSKKEDFIVQDLEVWTFE
uniref:Nuclear receptor coactivator 7 n=1 Tax=Ornithorhynchus anatinus TaxID=9258 RepID=A0A6I8NK54_ORNAN